MPVDANYQTNVQDLLQVRWTQARVLLLRGQAVPALEEWAVDAALGSETPEWIAPTLGITALIAPSSPPAAMIMISSGRSTTGI